MIWLIGCKGMLGSELHTRLKVNGMVHLATDIDVDITDPDAIRTFLSAHRDIEWIINAAAYTNVDKAEKEIVKAFRLNSLAVKNLVMAVEDHIKIIHFSTDYVFNGLADRPYRETDHPAPISVYGSSKLEGEYWLTTFAKRHFIFRISWLYGQYGKNFVNTMLRLFREKDRLNIVNDQIGAPTYTGYLADNIVHLIQHNSEKYGLYHYQDYSPMGISWFDFATAIKKLATKRGLIENAVELIPITSEEYPTLAHRPAYSVFDTNKVKKFLNFNIKSWEEGLSEYLRYETGG